MNLIDNGIKEVISIERVITDTELYFLVTFKDYYGAIRDKKLMCIDNLYDIGWME